MTTPETTEITEAKAKTKRRRRLASPSKQQDAPRAAQGRTTSLRDSGAPALAPDNIPDCDDGPIGRVAKHLAEADGNSGHAGIAADPNAGLIDELERILRGDEMAGARTARPPRFPSFNDDPLSFLNPDTDDDDDFETDEDDGDEAALAADQPRRRFPFAPEIDDVADEAPPAAEARRPEPTVEERPLDLYDDDRDGFDFFDEEPPRTADFWRSEDNAPPPELAGRSRRGPSRGFLTISALLLLVASGGVYSAVQFSAEPNTPTTGGPNVAAASAFGSPALPPPLIVETTIEPALIVEEPVPADEFAEAAGLAEPAPAPEAEAAPEPAVEVAAEPRVVPLFRTPDEGAATPEPVEPPIVVAAAEPAAATPEAPAPAAAAPEPVAEPAANEAPPPATPPVVVADTTPARVNDWVNLRASPSMGARVLEVIPLGATVDLVGCPGWCEVVYEGTRGFVGPDFIDRL